MRERLADMLIRRGADERWVDCAVCGEGYFTREEAVAAADRLISRGVRLDEHNPSRRRVVIRRTDRKFDLGAGEKLPGDGGTRK